MNRFTLPTTEEAAITIFDFFVFVIVIFGLLLFDLKLLLKDAIFCLLLFKILVATLVLYK